MPGPSKTAVSKKKDISTKIGTIKQLLTKHGDDPTYKVKSKKSPFHGKNVEELKKELYNLETIKANRTFSEQLQERKVSLKPTKKTRKKRNHHNPS